MTSRGLIEDLLTCGLLFEALCERDLRIYANTIDDQLYHYQDYKNHEFDAVIEMPDNRWAAIEVKLGANQIDAAAANLIAVNNDIQKNGGATAERLIVICGLSSVC